jgi:hypothetical protein
MQAPDKSITKLASYYPNGELGSIFRQARMINYFNNKLKNLLPKVFKTISISAIKDNKIFLATPDNTVAFRAKKQLKSLLEIIKEIDGLTHIKEIIIKIELK